VFSVISTSAERAAKYDKTYDIAIALCSESVHFLDGAGVPANAPLGLLCPSENLAARKPIGSSSYVLVRAWSRICARTALTLLSYFRARDWMRVPIPCTESLNLLHTPTSECLKR
jgi:hypothetical protein